MTKSVLLLVTTQTFALICSSWALYKD